MTLETHPATGQLALLALCGELVVAFEAERIHSIRQTVETPSRELDRGLHAIELEGTVIPGWDLGELLGLGACTSAWVIVDVPELGGWLGLRVGRCMSVQQLPTCRPLPSSIFTARPGALAAGFSAAPIAELEGYPTGAVVDPRRVLLPAELESGRQVRREGRDAAPQA